MRNFLINLVAILILVAVLALYFYFPPDSEQDNEISSAPSAPLPVNRLTADNFAAELAADWFATNKRYLYEDILISGKLLEYNSTILGQYIAKFRTISDIEIECWMHKKYWSRKPTLKKDQHVVMRCSVSTFWLNSITLRKCELVQGLPSDFVFEQNQSELSQTMTVDKISSEFKQNTAAAVKRYLEERVTICGMVQNLYITLAGVKKVDFYTKSGVEVTCRFSGLEKYQHVRLKEGRQATLRCVVDEFMDGFLVKTLSLRECEVVE